MATLKDFVETRLAPFQSKNFQRLFAAQSVSMVGSWMQELAKSWIVINLIGTASSIGGLMFAAAIPNIIFGSIGGVIADRWGAKRILILTQLLLATFAFAIGCIVFGGHVEYWHLLVFAVLEGTVLAFDIPAFNMITPQVVERKIFQQALALNTVNFHLSRTLGPAIAGLLMAHSDTHLVFWVNAASFLGIVFVITKLPLREKNPAEQRAHHQTGTMKEALIYLRNHPLFFRIFLQLFALMTLVFPMVFTVIRVFFQNEFHLTAAQFGTTMAISGIGALLGSLVFLVWSPKNPIRTLPYGILGIVLSLIALSQTRDFNTALMIQGLFSISMNLTMSALMVTLQLKVQDEFRGRVSALIGMNFASLSPMMGVPLGYFSDVVGHRKTIMLVSLAFGAISAYLALRARPYKFEDQNA